jgi:hypothetical protein
VLEPQGNAGGGGAAPASSAGDDGPSDLVLALGGVGGIVAGLLAGVAVAGMRRGRPA